MGQHFTLRCVTACLLASSSAQHGRADSLDIRFVEGLRQRRLFVLAEAYCADRLSRVTPRDAAQADLTVELIRTLAIHAANSPMSERDALWNKARATAASFLAQSPPHPRAAAVRFQDALTLMAQGELGRQEFEPGALPPDQVEPTRQALRQAAGLLESLDKELKAEIPLRSRATVKGSELSADELTRLEDQVQHQLARANKNRGLLFDRGSDNRLALLLTATDTLQRLLPQIPAGEALQQTLQLDLAECNRLLGRYAEAAELAAALDQDGVATTARLRARAELIRVAIGQNNFETARNLIESSHMMSGQTSAELEFARFEALVAFARAAGEGKRIFAGESGSSSQLAKNFQQQAAEQAELLEKTYGPYWGRRASQLLIASLPRGAMASVELLSRVADSLYLKGDFEQAIAAYDDAAGQAKTKGDVGAAFELAYKTALVEQKRGRRTAAADRLRILANSLPTHPQAAQAHLLAAWNVAQEAQTDASAAGQYQELLREHLSSWPATESADQARLWLGKLSETKPDWPDAINAYAAVSRASPHYASAIAALVRCWREELAALDAAGKPTAGASSQAIAFFRRAITGSDNRWPERWTDADRTAALAAAELIVAHQPGSASDAEDVLRRALGGSFDAPPSWRAAAQAQLVVALAAQGGRHSDALAELTSIGAASTDQMLAVLEGLSQVASRSSQRARPQVAAVQLAAVAMLAKSREQLSPEQRLTLNRVQVEALANTGRRDEAIAGYAQLAQSHPDNGSVQEGYARLLLTSSNPAQLKEGLDRWRLVASRTKPRTAHWFEAKYSVALAQFKLGDRSGAATLLHFLLETPPGLSGTEWEAAYTDLLRKCGQ